MQDRSFALSMHPLTHAWAKDHQSSDQQKFSWISAECIIALSWFGSTLWQDTERQLKPHMQSYLDVEIKTALQFGPESRIIPIFLQYGRILLQMRDDYRLENPLQNLFFQLNIDPRTPRQYLPIYDIEARSLHNLGLHGRAVELLEQVVRIQEMTLTENHPNRLASQHELARAYQANGQIKKVVELLEQVVRIEETTLTENHPSRLAPNNLLAYGLSQA
ncbi:MAG: hypothetical protein MMC23_009767 [Stictis urceolatum]|nr:hypothetical protein [Stictis urceolata]